MPPDDNVIMIAAPPVPPVIATPPAGTPPAAPATPPQTPATPPVDAPIELTPTPAAHAPTPPGNEEVVYEKTGDAGLDVALRYVGKRGFKPDHPAMQAATKGDFALLEAELAKLGDKADGYAEYIGLAKASFTSRQASQKQAAEVTAKAVYDAVGGKEAWATIQAWATANADEAEKAELNASFKRGGLAAVSAAKYVADLFRQHGKTAPKAVVKDTAGTGATDDTSGALMPRDFARESGKLYARLGSKMDSSPEYAALKARRQAYRA